MVDFVVFNACAQGAQYQAFWGSWQAGVGLALVIACGILALLYMAGRFFGNQQLEVWVKAEVGQLFITAAIAALGVGVVMWLCSFNPNALDSLFGRSPGQYAGVTFNGNAIDDFYDAANYYLKYLLTLNYIAYQLLIGGYFVVGHAMSAHYYADPIGIGFTIQPLAGMAPFSQVLIMVTQALTLSFLLVLIEIKVIEYLSIASLIYLFPFGVLLRAFEPTRMFGGSLIAFSLGMFIMFPALLVMNDYVVRTAQNELWLGVQQTGQNVQLTGSGAYGDISDISAESENQLELNPQRQTAGNIQISGKYESTNPTGFLDVQHSIMFILSGAMFIFISTVFLTAINFAVLIAFIKELSTMLGEEMDIASITRMI